MGLPVPVINGRPQKKVCNGKLIIAPINTTIIASLNAIFSVLFMTFPNNGLIYKYNARLGRSKVLNR